MKSSIYNIPIEINNTGILVYNSFSQCYLYVSKQAYVHFFSPDGTINVNQLNEKQVDLLYENGLVIGDYVDELAIAQKIKMSDRLQTYEYEIIINTTLDCNLNCWYCYESHTRMKYISAGTCESILHHIELKHHISKFSKLRVSLFGGEPLLAFKNVNNLLENIREFCKSEHIIFVLSITTNGTILPKGLLRLSNVVPTHFQITLDGNKSTHNQVRVYKRSRAGTYEKIISNVFSIINSTKDSHVTIRINYDEKTFIDYSDLLSDILRMDKKRITISLHKIWQVDGTLIDYSNVFAFVQNLIDHGYVVDFLKIGQAGTTCYADRLNSVVINFDGNIFKCTAIDFAASEKVGVLNQDGLILWDYKKLQAHCFACPPPKCVKCKLYPSCPGICSQSIIDDKENASCIIQAPLSMKEYILFNYKLKKAYEKSY